MDWQAWQAGAEIVGAVAVVVSLLYLAAQVRQNTRSVQAAANQELLKTYQGVIDFASQSAFGAHLLQGVLSGSWEEFSSEEQTAGRQIWIGICRMFEHAYLQNRAGLLPDETWRGWEQQLLLSSALPGFESTWPGTRLILNPDSSRTWNGGGTEERRPRPTTSPPSRRLATASPRSPKHRHRHPQPTSPV